MFIYREYLDTEILKHSAIYWNANTNAMKMKVAFRQKCFYNQYSTFKEIALNPISTEAKLNVTNGVVFYQQYNRKCVYTKDIQCWLPS